MAKDFVFSTEVNDHLIRYGLLERYRETVRLEFHGSPLKENLLKNIDEEMGNIRQWLEVHYEEE